MERERRKIQRMKKQYQVFCKAGDNSSMGECCDISEKGVGLYTNMDLQMGDSIEVRVVPKDEIFSFTCEGTVRHAEPVEDKNDYTHRIGIEFIEGLKDFASEQIFGSHDNFSGRQSMVITASQQDCYDTICNFESYPSWQKVISEARILEIGSDSRPEVVEFTMDAILKKVKFINKYEYFDKDYILSWKAAGGDVKVNDGSYVFQKLRGGRTNAIFSVYIELGFYAPKRIVDYMNKITMRNSIRALKDTVESGVLKKK